MTYGFSKTVSHFTQLGNEKPGRGKKTDATFDWYLDDLVFTSGDFRDDRVQRVLDDDVSQDERGGLGGGAPGGVPSV